MQEIFWRFSSRSSCPVSNYSAHCLRCFISSVETYLLSSCLLRGIGFGLPSRNILYAITCLHTFLFKCRKNTTKGTCSSPDSAMTPPIDCVPCVKIAIIDSSLTPSQKESKFAAVVVKPDTVGSEYLGCIATLSVTVEPIKLGEETVQIPHDHPNFQSYEQVTLNPTRAHRMPTSSKSVSWSGGGLKFLHVLR